MAKTKPTAVEKDKKSVPVTTMYESPFGSVNVLHSTTDMSHLRSTFTHGTNQHELKPISVEKVKKIVSDAHYGIHDKKYKIFERYFTEVENTPLEHVITCDTLYVLSMHSKIILNGFCGRASYLDESSEEDVPRKFTSIVILHDSTINAIDSHLYTGEINYLERSLVVGERVSLNECALLNTNVTGRYIFLDNIVCTKSYFSGNEITLVNSTVRYCNIMAGDKIDVKNSWFEKFNLFIDDQCKDHLISRDNNTYSPIFGNVIMTSLHFIGHEYEINYGMYEEYVSLLDLNVGSKHDFSSIYTTQGRELCTLRTTTGLIVGSFFYPYSAIDDFTDALKEQAGKELFDRPLKTKSNTIFDELNDEELEELEDFIRSIKSRLMMHLTILAHQSRERR